ASTDARWSAGERKPVSRRPINTAVLQPMRRVFAISIPWPPYCSLSNSGGEMAVLVQRNLGFLLLAIFLVLYGLASMMTLGLPPIVMAVLALMAGILILLGR